MASSSNSSVAGSAKTLHIPFGIGDRVEVQTFRWIPALAGAIEQVQISYVVRLDPHSTGVSGHGSTAPTHVTAYYGKDVPKDIQYPPMITTIARGGASAKKYNNKKTTRRNRFSSRSL